MTITDWRVCGDGGGEPGTTLVLLLHTDGAFLATFGKGVIGRARSERRSSFVSKLMHEHLATRDGGAARDVGGPCGWVYYLWLRLRAKLGCSG